MEIGDPDGLFELLWLLLTTILVRARGSINTGWLYAATEGGP